MKVYVKVYTTVRVLERNPGANRTYVGVFFFFFSRFFSLIGYYIILSIVPWATQ